MKRIATHIILVIVAFVAVGALGVYLGTQALLEHYRPQLLAEITEAVGCPATYRRATLRLTPALEVVLHDVAVMGTDLGFEVSAPYLSAEVKLSALIQRQLDFDRLTLRSPTIVIVTGDKGSAGTQPLQPEKPLSSTPLAVTPPTQPVPLPGIDSISIESGIISKRNSTGKESVLLEDLHITSSIISHGVDLTVSPSQASFILPIHVKGDKRLPFTASLQQLRYTASPRSISIASAQLATGPSSVTVSGAIALDSGAVTATVQGTKVGIAVIQQIIGTQGLAGTADIQATVSIDEQTTAVTGSVSLTGAQAVASTGERYGIASLSGPIAITRTLGAGTKISSPKLGVVGFSYQDPNVSLNHVNGSLSAILGTIGEDGATTFAVTVQGTALDLTSGPFTIKKIDSVSAPLTVSVPSTGYSVSGPVQAAGVEMTFHGRPMSAAAGSVDMLVSHQLLRFVSKGIRTQSNGVPLSISGTLDITDTDYKMSNVVGTMGDGKLAASVDMQREPHQEVQAEVLAQGLDVASVKAVLFGEPKGAFSGRIDHVSVKATARKSDLLKSARGQGIIEITDGSVRQANFDRRVVGLIRAIPVVGSAITFSATSADNSTYQVQGGMLKNITADFTVATGKLSSTNIKAQGRLMNLEATGDVHLNGGLNLVASAIYLEQNLKALAGPITPLGSLFGTLGKIEIPLLITGTIDSPQISADITRLQDISAAGRAISPLFRGIESIVNGVSGK
jgi:hypothetical protein